MNYTISTFAGTGESGFAGDGGAAASAQFASPFAIALDGSGNLYITDTDNQRIRKITSSGTVSTIVGDGTAGYTGNDAAATSAQINNPGGLFVDGSGNVFFADTYNHAIRKISGGNITKVVGIATGGFGGDGAAAGSAAISSPLGVAVDSAGLIYVVDTGNNRIRKTDSDGNINTIVGDGTATSAGDGGQATSASLNHPLAVLLDGTNGYYIADTNNHKIRYVNSEGVISTIAGTGEAGFSGDGGPASQAQLNYPKAIAKDGNGNLFIADQNNNRIRMITSDGIIWTVAGNGAAGSSGDDGQALHAQLNGPTGLVVDSSGKLYVVDAGNHKIRLLTPGADPVQLPAISGGGVIGASSFGRSNSVAPGSWIEIYGSNLAYTTRQWATSDFNGNAAPVKLAGTKVTIGGSQTYISYVSPTQVNVLLPLTVPTGEQQVIVTTDGGVSSPVTVTVDDTKAGLLAPASLKVGALQYAGALFNDGSTFVAPAGAISGVTSRPAAPGETIVMYGVGFGPVSPYIGAGEVVGEMNTLASPFQVTFNGTPGTIVYAGMAPGAVALYQFNVVVPEIADSDAVPVKFTLGTAEGTQTLYTAVKR